MYPVYRYMDSYPQTHSHPRNHFSYPYHNYPNWEATPPQMKIDPSESPMNFKSWPYNTSTCFGYPNPAESDSCCNHSYPSGFYSFRPPHSYPMPPPPLYYHGPYPPYPDAFPACFIPPHYSAEKGQYEHDKGMGRDHCCGCPNHTCNGKVESNVWIEEERPEIEHKDGNGSVGMTKLQGQHYPIVWVPSDYVKEKQSSKHPEPTDPKPWNGWVPLDLNRIKPLMQGVKEKGNKNQQTEDKKPSHFPFPIIWMPGYDNAKDIGKNDLKDINVSQNPVAESPKFKIIPVKLLENGERGEKLGIAEEVLGGADLPPTTEKETKAKSKPPEKVDESTENKSKTNSRSTPVKRVEEKREEETSDENGEKKRSDDNGKKASKLRPVCLRVDLLSKKKNGNGTLRSPSPRSPSPPGVKDAVRHGSKPEEPALSKANEGESKKKESKVIKVQDKKAAPTNEAKQPPKPNDAVQANQGESKKKEVKVVDAQEKSKGTLDVNAAEVTREEITVQRKELSEDDAAILIQSAYRGFEVRKWEPLKKMRQIAKVRDQTGNVRERVLCLEMCIDQQQCEKQRLIIGEIIMNLLLQLDAIQGLHPSVRDVRKSVATELVCLQEKLDSLVTRKAAGLIPTSAEAARLEIASDDDSEHVRDVNSSMLRSEPISNPVASVSAPTVSHSDRAEEAAEQLTEMLETKMKETKSAMENGVPNGAIGGPADPLQLVNECQNSASEKSSRLELEKNDERDSAVEGSIRFTKRDEECDSGVEILMRAEIAPAEKVEEPALKEFSEPPLERDYKAESLAEPSDVSEKMNSMTEECKRTPSKDSNRDSAVVGFVKPSERDGESHLGIKEPLMEAAPNVKDEETSSKADVVTEVPSSQNEEFKSEPTAKAVGNATSELPVVQDESAEELPSFSEENNTGVDSIAGELAHWFGLVQHDAYVIHTGGKSSDHT